MDAREAVRAAKQYITEMFDGEPLINVGLEEVVYEEDADEWEIILSFARDWNRTSPFFPSQDDSSKQRYFKMIKIRDGTGEVLALTDPK